MEEGKYIRFDVSNELIEPDETITNHEVIDIIGLTVRWCGATDDDILRQNRLGNLPVYKVHKINRTPKGGIERVLRPSSISIEEGGGPGEEEFFLIGIDSVCLLPDVINVEKRRPDFLHEKITPHEEESPSHPLIGESTHSTELEADLTTALQQVEELKQSLADTRAELAEAQAAAPQEVVTVNAALWEASCEAACAVTEQIAKNHERGITKGAFLDRMRAAATGKKTCSGADKVAWKALPDEYKNGPGCPKK